MHRIGRCAELGYMAVNEISTAFYFFEFLFTSMANNGDRNVYLIIAHNNLGFKVLMVTSGIKDASEKRHKLNFLWICIPRKLS